MYLLDTNIISLYFRENRLVATRLRDLDENQVLTCTPVVAELLFGVKNHPNYEASKLIHRFYLDFLKLLEIKDWTVKSADIFAEIKHKLKKQGKTLEDMDIIIASIAIAYDLILVTNNTKDFANIEELRTEDWTIAL